MKTESLHDIILATVGTLLAGGIVALFSLNNSVIRLTEEIKGIKSVTDIQIQTLTDRVVSLEDKR